jgi:hypothetical protein
MELFITASDSSDQEELLLNVIAACTNITYYACQVEIVELIFIIHLIISNLSTFVKWMKVILALQMIGKTPLS